MDNEERAIEAQEAAEMAITLPTAADDKSLIAVTQLPIIEERLRDYKAEIEKTVADAKSMVATAETVQAVKNTRADLRKQFDTLDKRRIAVKDLILEPYERFNAVYKECVATPFQEADAALKATVDSFEGELKSKALKKLEANYNEHCKLEGIDWIPFDQALTKSGVKIGMVDTKTKEPRKAMDALANFVSRIAVGMDQVRQMEDSAEIMVEFKKCLDAGQAAATVQERKRRIREAQEAEERRREETARQREMQARVEAVAPIPAPPPITPPAPVATPPQAAEQQMCWKKMSFTIYFRNQEEYQKVLPELKALKEKLVQEGIQYGK